MRSVLVVLGLLVLGAPVASAQDCRPGEMVLGPDGVFRVCGEVERPSATYVLPRSRSERIERELRRRMTDEIVRDGDRL